VTKKGSYSVTREQAIKLISFAQENHLVINPVGYEYYAMAFNEFHHCPCDKKRLSCPCDLALAEIEKDGHCTCQLYWRNYKVYIAKKLQEG
jgi:hypothetical protein